MISSYTVFGNHHSTLDLCLRSAAAAVDEVVAVNTGSTDGSDEIARACGARIVDFPWCEDISAARNAGLEAAAGDWILGLDADDELASPEAVRPLTAVDGVHGWILRLDHLGMAKPTYGEALRLFRSGLRYEGIIHEQLLIPSGWILRRAPEVVIRHSGFSAETLDREKKAERNLRLGLLEIERDPTNPRAHARGAKCLMSADRPGEALFHYLKALELTEEKTSQVAEYYMWATTAAQRLGDHTLAAQLAHDGLALYPDYVDLRCLAAWSCRRLGRVPEARRQLLEALYRFDHLGEYPVSGSVTRALILDVLNKLPLD